MLVWTCPTPIKYQPRLPTPRRRRRHFGRSRLHSKDLSGNDFRTIRGYHSVTEDRNRLRAVVIEAKTSFVLKCHKLIDLTEGDAGKI